MNETTLILTAIGSAAIGSAITWLFLRKNSAAAEARLREEHGAEKLQLSTRLATLEEKTARISSALAWSARAS